MLTNFERHWVLIEHKFYQWRPGDMETVKKQKKFTRKVAAITASGYIVFCEI